MKKTLLTLLVLIIVGGLLSFFYHSRSAKDISSTPSEDHQTLKVGALLLLSGDFSTYGERSKNAIELAVNEYNSHPGHKQVEVIYEDTHGDPKQAVSAYKKLTTVDKVDAIVGPLLQAETAAITPLIEHNNIPVFSVAPVPIDRRGKTTNPLVVWPDPSLEAGQIAQYIHDQGIKNVGILGTQDSWENEVSDVFGKKFAELGGIVSKEIVLQDATDVRLEVTRMLSKKPEAVFIGSYYKFFQFAKTLNEQGFKGKLYSIEIDQSLVDQAKDFTNGLQFISPDFYTQDFSDEFLAAYKVKPSLPSGQAYDAMNILLGLFSQYGDRVGVLKAIGDLREFDGVSGKIVFTEDHRATFPLSIFEIQKGSIVKIK